MQNMYGLDAPVYGRILADTVKSDNAVIDPGDYARRGVEFEIAVRLGRGLNRVPPSVAALADFVDAVCPAPELIDDLNAAGLFAIRRKGLL